MSRLAVAFVVALAFALSTKKRCGLPLSSLHHTLHKVSPYYLLSPEFPRFNMVQSALPDNIFSLALFPQNDNCCLLSILDFYMDTPSTYVLTGKNPVKILY